MNLFAVTGDANSPRIERMIVQVYEIADPAEAALMAELGVDHVGVLVGCGAYPRERRPDQAGGHELGAEEPLEILPVVPWPVKPERQIVQGVQGRLDGLGHVIGLALFGLLEEKVIEGLLMKGLPPDLVL